MHIWNTGLSFSCIYLLRISHMDWLLTVWSEVFLDGLVESPFTLAVDSLFGWRRGWSWNSSEGGGGRGCLYLCLWYSSFSLWLSWIFGQSLFGCRLVDGAGFDADVYCPRVFTKTAQSVLILVEAPQPSLAQKGLLAGHLRALAQCDEAIWGGDFG